MIEAGMIGVGKNNDDFSLSLNHFLKRHSQFAQEHGRNHTGLVTHEVGAPF